MDKKYISLIYHFNVIMSSKEEVYGVLQKIYPSWNINIGHKRLEFSEGRTSFEHSGILHILHQIHKQCNVNCGLGQGIGGGYDWCWFIDCAISDEMPVMPEGISDDEFLEVVDRFGALYYMTLQISQVAPYAAIHWLKFTREMYWEEFYVAPTEDCAKLEPRVAQVLKEYHIEVLNWNLLNEVVEGMKGGTIDNETPTVYNCLFSE
jgi:hypothetical protein